MRQKIKNNKKYIIISSLVVLIVSLLVIQVLFNPSESPLSINNEHLTSEYTVNDSLAEITKSSDSAYIAGGRNVKSIFVISNKYDEEIELRSDRFASFYASEPMRATIIVETKSGEKYVIDTIEFESGFDINDQ